MVIILSDIHPITRPMTRVVFPPAYFPIVVLGYIGTYPG